MNVKFLALCAAALFTFPTFAQEMAMPQVADTVQEFLDVNGHDMNQLVPSCQTFDACSHMNYHSKTYTFKGNAQAAFEKLIAMGPLEIWKSSSRFEMEYDPESKSFLGKNHELPPLKKGQVFFLELDIVKKMQIPVAFQVVELDASIRTVTFSYLKQNKSNGSQRITFHQVGENMNIVHETHYKSDSRFRDKHLYGYFHTRLLDDVWEDFGRNL